MSHQSDSSESLSSSTISSPRTTEESSESSSSKPSEITPSTPQPTQGKRLWKPGQSGNPAGRPKGTKNQITLLKEGLELRLRNKAAYKIEKVLDKAIEMALNGDKLMIKLLLELHMSKAAHMEDAGGGKSQVAVVIQNLTDGSSVGGYSLDGSGPSKVVDVTPTISENT